MSQVATPTIELADDVFDASSYDLPIPAQDGYKAEKITIRFVGVCDLDRTNEDDLEFVAALRLGKPVRLIVSGSVSGKGFTHQVKSDDEETVGYYCSVRIGEDNADREVAMYRRQATHFGRVAARLRHRYARGILVARQREPQVMAARRRSTRAPRSRRLVRRAPSRRSDPDEPDPPLGRNIGKAGA